MSWASWSGSHGPSRGRARLPVVRHQRPLAPGERHRGERLGLAGQHLAAGVGGEPQRGVAEVELALGRLAGDPQPAPRARRRARPGRRARPPGPAPRSARRGRWRGAAASSSPSSSSRRRSGSRSSNSRNTSRSRERSGSRAIAPSMSMSRSMSRIAVASRLLIRAASACSVRFSLRLAPEMLSMFDEHPLEVAACLEQLGRGLLTNPRDARDVVRGVALEAREVGDQLRRDAVPVDHGLAVVGLRLGDAAAGGHHTHAVADELEHVAVAGHDHHRDPLRLACSASVAITSSAS